jgi:hypothetical protein
MFSLTQELAMLVLGAKENRMSRGLMRKIVSNFMNLTAHALMLSVAVLCLGSTARAADITWGGTYRVEGIKLINPELSSDKSDKSYILNHLILSPKIVAADGVTIFGRLDVLNDPNFGINSAGQVNSVAGDLLGNGPGSATPARGTDSNAFGRTQRASPLQVTALYASWTQEFGQLIVGRVPIQFGLGTAYSAGNGMFDHFIDTKDLVAYKIVLGNMFIMPILGKVSEGNLGNEDDVNDYMVHVQYDNPESELSLGFMFDLRVVQGTGNDTPTTPGFWGAGFTNSGSSFKNQLMSFYFSQKAGSSLRASVEADLFSGDTGLKNGAGNNVGLNSFGVAAEFAYIPPVESKWDWKVKLGLASGDDPGTQDTYEGYQFNRNYDVGMIMFNHPLGHTGTDFLRTGFVRDTSSKPSNQIDSEAVSNALYLSPSFQYRTRDNLSYGAAFVYGMLNKDPLTGNVGTSTNLGYELDLNVAYKPVERLTWITEAGFMLPGEAWKGGSSNFENRPAYGITTKAAINF